MRCPYCNCEVKDDVKFCTECGATLNAAAVQRERGEQITADAGSAALMLGAAARKARLSQAVTEDQLVSARVYNGVMLGVLLWGLLVNVVLCATLGGFVSKINPLALMILYVVCAFGGIMIAGRSDKPLISFLGYNLVVVPFGLMLSAVVAEYGGVRSAVVTDAFLYTLFITAGMTGAALAFPNLFAKLGGALLGTLVGLVICELLLLIFRVGQNLTDWIAAGLFSLYIGYDVYRSQQFAKTLDNAVDCALDIYLDIANLFIRLLRLLSRRRD